MTDKNPENRQANTPASNESKSSPGSATSPARPKRQEKGRPALAIALIVVVVLALGLGAALWYQQKIFRQARTAVMSQLESSTSAANQASEQAQQALSLAQSQSGELSALQAALHESQARYQSLEQAFQTLTDSGSDLVLVNDVDHLVTIAHQQLSLGGNVANAIVALETAQAQLARANRPNLASLQQTINGDLDRLRLAATIDVPLLSGRLNELSKLVSRAPLWVPDDAAPKVSNSVAAPADAAAAGQDNDAADDADAPWWQRSIATVGDWSVEAWSALRQDLGKFISVRRAENPAALLMSPDQAGQLRENLRLHIMTAQLALLMHQPEIWQTETQALVQALSTRYDPQASDTRQARKIALQLADTAIGVKLPTVSNSLQALETLRESAAKAAQQQAVEPAAEGVPSPAEAPAATAHAPVPAAPPANPQPTKPQE